MEWPLEAAAVIFKFGEFELDTGKRELRRGTRVCATEPQVFNLLAFLIENRDRVVTRDELVDVVWSKRIVSESVIGSRINAARRAVNDDGKRQCVIRTLRKSGLRFVGTIVEAGVEGASASRAPKTHRAAFDLTGAPPLALLPFVAVDGSARSHVVAASLAEELQFFLYGVEWLRVIAPHPLAVGARRAVRSADEPARYVLEGSVRVEGDHCVVFARLTDARTRVCLWSERSACTSGDAGANLAQIARSIAHAVGEQVFAVERIRARTVPAHQRTVWDVVVVALSMIGTRRKDRVREAQHLLRSVIGSDIKSSAVLSLLSFCETLGVHLGWVSRKARAGRALGYVEQALALNDQDPWAYLALGYARLYMENRTDEAITMLDHAVNLDPTLSIGHYLIALSSAYLGDTEKAFKEADIAERLSPLDLLAKGNVGAHDNVRATTSFVAGRYRDGINFAQRVLSLSPLQIPAQRQIVLNAAFAGDMKLAKGAIDKVTAGAPDIQRWLDESASLWSRTEDYNNYVRAFRIAGHH